MKRWGTALCSAGLALALLASAAAPVQAEELPTEPGDQEATVSKRTDQATNTQPDMATRFYMYIPPDPEYPVGVIEVFRPGSDAKYGGSVTKEFPQTGGGTDADKPEQDDTPDALQRTWQDGRRTAPIWFWQDGSLYLRQWQLSRETPAITQTKTYTELTEQTVPGSLSVEQDGIPYSLTLQQVTYQGYTGHLQAEGTLDHGYLTAKPEAPEQKEIVYTDPATGAAQTISAQLLATEQTEPYAWRPVEFPLRYLQYYTTTEFTVYQLDDTYLPYDDNAPYWQDTDNVVLRHLELPQSRYRLTGSAWLSGWEPDARGLPVRYGVLEGEMFGARWVSTYAAQVDIPLYTATAVYSNEAEAGTSTVMAQYMALPVALVVTGALVGVLLILALIIVILFLLKHKKEKKQKEGAEGR